MPRRPVRRVVSGTGLVAGAALALTACAAGGQSVGPRSDDGFYGAVLEQRYDVPAVTLADEAGRPFDVRADTDRPVTLVFFGYTNCPDVCTTVMGSIAAALSRLEPAQRRQVDVLFVTTDPARDDGAALTAYLDRLDPSFVGLTGELADIERLGRALGVYVEQGRRLPTGGYEVDHGTPVLGVDESDRVPIVWTHPTSPAQLAADLTALLETPLEDA